MAPKVAKSRQIDAGNQPTERSIADELRTKTPTQVIKEIHSKLRRKPRIKGPAYTLILGAGFSHPAVPLTRQLLEEEIGNFDDRDEEQSDNRHTAKKKRRLSATFWKAFNAPGKPPVELNKDGLPANITAAYQLLFTPREINQQLESDASKSQPKFMRGSMRAPVNTKTDLKPRVLGGEKFVKKFLRYVLDPSRSEECDVPEWRHDSYTSGRNQINGAHFFLASLLELQQTGQAWEMRPFCRTIFTTNFDTLLQDALQLVNVLYCLTDRPELGLDASHFPEEEPVIHLVYTHGSILRHNPASTDGELQELMKKNTGALTTYLQKRDIIVMGYGGWPDSLMAALAKCKSPKQSIYWCDVVELDKPIKKLAPDAVALLKKAKGRAWYVCLGSRGADGFMEELLRKIAPVNSQGLIYDPIPAYLHRLKRVKLGNLMPGSFAAALEHLKNAVESRTAYRFQHSVEVGVGWEAAWRFWRNVGNWTLDADIEWVKLDGPFQPGADGTTKRRGADLLQWKIAEVNEGGSAVIEIPMQGAAARFAWKFEDLAENRTRLTQQITLSGVGADKYAANMGEGFERGIREGMAKLSEEMERTKTKEAEAT